MEPPDLITVTLAPDAAPRLHFNPRLPDDRHPSAGLRAWLADQPQLRGHHLFQTSGTTSAGAGAPWVALSAAAVRASALAVNQHLGTTPDDSWLLALPTFHVGGFGILQRAALAAIPVFATNWDPARYARTAADTGATLSALVPTQVSDLVRADLCAPANLRAVLVGGGRLDPDLHRRARQLGWPLLRTFGMTETASQVATEISPSAPAPTDPDRLPGPWLPVLAGWQLRLAGPIHDPGPGPANATRCGEPAAALELRGPALFSGYVQPDLHAPDSWQWVDPRRDGWWRCRDLVRLRPATRRASDDQPRLQWRGRIDRTIKVMGELVDLDAVEARLQALARDPGPPAAIRPAVTVDWLAVIRCADARAGDVPVLVLPAGLATDQIRRWLEQADAQLAPFERPRALWRIDSLPRSPLGKVRYARLEQRLAAAVASAGGASVTASQIRPDPPPPLEPWPPR